MSSRKQHKVMTGSELAEAETEEMLQRHNAKFAAEMGHQQKYLLNALFKKN
jgi:hypothetical protein